LASTLAASLQGRIALGPRAGKLVCRLRSAADAITTGRRADLCWPTMGSSARGRAGDRPSSRSRRRPTHVPTSTRARRDAGPGRGRHSPARRPSPLREGGRRRLHRPGVAGVARVADACTQWGNTVGAGSATARSSRCEQVRSARNAPTTSAIQRASGISHSSAAWRAWARTPGGSSIPSVTVARVFGGRPGFIGRPRRFGRAP
jgi:hypothetical protein